MASIEKRIVGVLLTAIRARREEPAVTASYAYPHSGRNTAPARVREACFSDFQGVAELKRRWGLAEDSPENWERLWRTNPALAHFPSERPIGWVLEAEGKLVGYLGNIFQLYRYGDKTLASVTAHGLVVDPPYRALGASLVAAYFRQKDVDLYISTGEIAPVGKIGRAFKSEPLPHEDYEAVLFWVLQPYSFVRAVLKKLRLGPALSYFCGVLGSLVVGTDRILRGRWPKSSSADLAITEISLGEIGIDFNKLWMEKVNEKRRLLADRSPTMLRWHFEVPGDKGSVKVLCCSKEGKLVGYAVIRNEPADETSLQKSTIADMLVKNDDPAVMEALLSAGYRHAEQAGSHILEVLGFPPSIRRSWSQWRPYIRKYPTPLFAYKAVDPIMHKAISVGETWYASPFDGDFNLIRPSYPASTHRTGAGEAQTKTEPTEPVLRGSRAGSITSGKLRRVSCDEMSMSDEQRPDYIR